MLMEQKKSHPLVHCYIPLRTQSSAWVLWAHVSIWCSMVIYFCFLLVYCDNTHPVTHSWSRSLDPPAYDGHCAYRCSHSDSLTHSLTRPIRHTKSSAWVLWTHVSIWGSIVIYFCFLLVYCVIWPTFGYTIAVNIFHVDYQMYSSGVFWCVFACVGVRARGCVCSFSLQSCYVV